MREAVKVDYSWEVETLSDCANGLDAANLRELIQTLRADGKNVLAGLIVALETMLESMVDEGLCPNCLSELVVKTKMCFSNGWDEPPGSWEEADGSECLECGYEV